MTASYQHTWYILIYSTRSVTLTHIGQHSKKKLLAITAEYSQAHKSTVSVSEVKWKMALTQISVNILCLFQIIKHPFQSGKLGSDKFPVCFVCVCVTINKQHVPQGPGFHESLSLSPGDVCRQPQAEGLEGGTGEPRAQPGAEIWADPRSERREEPRTSQISATKGWPRTGLSHSSCWASTQVQV